MWILSVLSTHLFFVRSTIALLVINLRYLNQHLLKEKCKCEDLRLAMLMFQKGDFLFSFNLKSGYHHVDTHKDH